MSDVVDHYIISSLHSDLFSFIESVENSCPICIWLNLFARKFLVNGFNDDDFPLALSFDYRDERARSVRPPYSKFLLELAGVASRQRWYASIKNHTHINGIELSYLYTPGKY